MNTAYIRIWNHLVGAVAWDERNGLASFEYDPAFRKLNIELAPLKMPVSSSKRIFSFPELKRKKDSDSDTFKGMPGLLADALPDKYGNQLINAWLASQGRPEESLNPVEMLCFIGKRGMGALEFEPTMIQESRKSFPVEIDSLIETAQKMLSNKDKFSVNLQKDEQKALMEIVKIGTSAGGARPKAVIAYNESTGEVKSGQTETPKGFEHWLIKLDGVSAVQLGSSNGYGRVEMAYYKMAVACGIKMMPSRLLEENGRAHFMTRRFDRSEGSIKHHIQTFCAMKHVDFNQIQSFSYEQLFQTMRELKLSYSDTDQMFRRMAFNVIARNCDDHTKNFAFSLKEGGKWELAPAYDICHAYRPGSDWVSQHSLSIQNKRKDFTKDDLLKFGESVQCKNAGSILAEIQEVVSRWTQFANDTQVSEKIRDEIGKTHLILF